MSQNQALIAKTVAIIVPVYGDWASLSDCIDSLLRHTPANCTVLFANDHGPEWQVIGGRLKQKIKGKKKFQYIENATNLGFVQNCNHAVFDVASKDSDILLLNSDTVVTEGFLDEIRAVAASSEKIGTVCPRSNDATIATIPLRVRHGNGRDANRAYQVFKAIKAELPRITIAPVSVGFCMYIKRSLITQFGLFDTIYGKGYGEENDFCMRINQHGYLSVMANRAFVYHQSAKSFTPELRSRLVEENEKKLVARYPYYPRLVANYFLYDVHPIDYFADCIVKTEQPGTIKILIDLHSLPASAVDDVARAKQLLSGLTIFKNVEYHVATSRASWNALAVNMPHLRHFEVHEIDGIYDVGYSVLPVTDINHLVFLQQHCLKIVIDASQQDVFYNNVYRQSADIDYATQCLVAYCDAVIAPSEAVLAKLTTLWPELRAKGVVAKAPRDVAKALVATDATKVNYQSLQARWLSITSLVGRQTTLLPVAVAAPAKRSPGSQKLVRVVKKIIKS